MKRVPLPVATPSPVKRLRTAQTPPSKNETFSVVRYDLADQNERDAAIHLASPGLRTRSNPTPGIQFVSLCVGISEVFVGKEILGMATRQSGYLLVAMQGAAPCAFLIAEPVEMDDKKFMYTRLVCSVCKGAGKLLLAEAEKLAADLHIDRVALRSAFRAPATVAKKGQTPQMQSVDTVEKKMIVHKLMVHYKELGYRETLDACSKYQPRRPPGDVPFTKYDGDGAGWWMSKCIRKPGAGR